MSVTKGRLCNPIKRQSWIIQSPSLQITKAEAQGNSLKKGVQFIPQSILTWCQLGTRESIHMNRQSVIQAITERVESAKPVDYSLWTIGLTHFPNERKRPRQWIADSLSDAQDIESYFINKKGMKGGTTEDLNDHKTVCVYIFWHRMPNSQIASNFGLAVPRRFPANLRYIILLVPNSGTVAI